MLRAVVPNRWAIEFRLSPRATVYTKKVGWGVGVGGTNDGRGVGPLGAGDAVGPAAARSPDERVAAGMQATTATHIANAPTKARRRRRRRRRAGRRAEIRWVV